MKRLLNNGTSLIYLRRSGRNQEHSLEAQLKWGMAEAARRGIALDVSIDDLNHMLAGRLNSYRSIRLDNAITGWDLNRPGLLALIQDAIADLAVTHVFVFKRDRLGRPEYAAEMMQIEQRLNIAGIHIVFSGSEAPPLRRGERSLSQTLQSIIEYDAAGQFCELLAERMVLTHQALAIQGFSCGGTPPYGHVRGLFGPNGEFVEVLPPGKYVRQQGYHVRWIPGSSEEDRQKIKTWLWILATYRAGLGSKRIASQLNDRGILSPGAGRRRTYRGESKLVPSKWHHTTVLDLIKNSIALGIKTHGVRAEGKHRRLGEQGCQFLSDEDFDAQGNARLRKNSDAVVIKASSGSEPIVDIESWNQTQQMLESRGSSQRGVSRAKNVSRYPLSCLVYCDCPGCNQIMYGVPQSGRLLYKCSQYMKYNGCHHNSVDAEALFQFLLEALRQHVKDNKLVPQLRDRLLELAQAEVESSEFKKGRQSQSADCKNRIADLEMEAATIARNLAHATNPHSFAAIENELTKVTTQLEAARNDLKQLSKENSMAAGRSQQLEVDSAMSLLDNLNEVVTDPTARYEVGQLLKLLGCRIGLTFTDGIKGAKRKVRVLAGGVLTFGESKTEGSSKVPFPPAPSGETTDTNRNLSAENSPKRANDCHPSKSPPGRQEGLLTLPRHHEGTSYTKVSRADRIRTCDLLTPSQTRYQTAPRPDFFARGGRTTPRPAEFGSLTGAGEGGNGRLLSQARSACRRRRFDSVSTGATARGACLLLWRLTGGGGGGFGDFEDAF